uniref:Uncharacterized protein n=1 Tax=Aegilops tauschii subsp. strangulata TaxID=200361 RepID=A0A453RTL3_AEGTS
LLFSLFSPPCSCVYLPVVLLSCTVQTNLLIWPLIIFALHSTPSVPLCKVYLLL